MQTTVGIIGAGVAGIAAARACLQRGLSVTLFESRSAVGGIWTRQSTPVFDNLTTNTACFETAFSDVPPIRVEPKPTLNDDDNLCLTREELGEYLAIAVARTPGLSECIHFNRHVITISACEDGYQVTSRDNCSQPGDDGQTFEDVFNYVIVATGDHNAPATPPPDSIPGLASFPGTICHVKSYKNPAQFRGKRVLVVGGSISGCEAAGDMAFATPDNKPASVVLSTRKMRFVAKKQSEARVLISDISTRFHNLYELAGQLWSEEYVDYKENLICSFSKNEDFNLPPAQD